MFLYIFSMKNLFLTKTVARCSLIMAALTAWAFQANAAWYMHGNFPSLNGNNGNSWKLNQGREMTQDGSYAFYAYDIVFPGGVDNYYFFASELGPNGDDSDWDNYINLYGRRWGPSTDGSVINKGDVGSPQQLNHSYKWSQTDNYNCYVLYRTYIDNHKFVINDEIYLVGLNGDWNFDNAIKLHYDRDGLYRAGNVTVTADSYFYFAGAADSNFYYRPASDGQAVGNNEWVTATLANTGTTNAYRIPAGTYEVTFNIKNLTFQFNRHIDKLYVIGQVNGNSWAADTGLEMTRVSYNVFKAEHVQITQGDTLAFTTKLAETGDDWLAIKDYRVTTASVGQDGNYWPVRTDYLDMPLNLTGPKRFDSEEPGFRMEAETGYYDIDVNMNNMTVRFTARNTPWDGISYEWKDENGDTHESDLTDPATDPRQMLALFNEVYTNTKVPGQLEHNEYLMDGTKAKYQRNPRKIDYDRHSYLLYGISNMPGTSTSTNFSETGLVRDCTTNPPTMYNFRTNTNATGNVYERDKFKRRIPWLKIKGRMGYDLTPNDTVYPPEKDGMTLLLVEVSDEWNNRKDYNRDDMTGGGSYRPVDNNILPITKKSLKSVRVIPQYLRINDPDNPGYLFVIDKITTQRFFFASKGREQRGDAYGSSNAPLFTAFECIAPETTKINPEALREGKVEYVQHDCYNIWQKGENDGHFIDLTGSEAATFNNLALFVPDKRFPGLDWDPDTRDINYSNSAASMSDDLTKNYHQKEVNKKWRPKLLLYKAFLDASVAKKTEGVYTVTLHWNTWFDSQKLETSVNQQYYVYVKNANGDWVNVGTLHPQSGLGVGGTTREQTLVYDMPQTDATQTLTYMVTANPIDVTTDENQQTKITASSIKVNTNTATIMIPGRERFVMNVADHRSRFALNTDKKELNVYRNTPVITLNEGVPVTGKPFEIYRSSSDGDVKIASFTLTPGTGGDYSYTLAYEAGTQNYDVLYDENDVTRQNETLSGTLSAGGSVKCVDLFTASTASNNHPAQYTYEVKLWDDDQDKYDSRSNKYVVPVLKSETSVVMGGFTKDDVDNDTDHGLFEDHEIQVSFMAQIDEQRSLDKYNVHRVDNSDTSAPSYDYHIAKAERNNDNKISLINVDHATGHLSKEMGIHDVAAEPEGKKKLTVYDDTEYCQLEDPHYVTEIRTVKGRDGDNWLYNTYGTAVVDIEEPQMEFECVGNKRTDPYSGGDHTAMGFSAELVVRPTEMPDNLRVYRYRIWRVNEDGSETLLNEVSSVQNPYIKLGTLEDKWPTPDVSAGQRTFPEVKVTDMFEGKALANDITFEEEDPVTGEKETVTEVRSKKTVKYIARMYTSTYGNATANGAQNAPRRMDAPERGPEPEVDDEHQWYVTEKDITVLYDYTDTPTAVSSIATDSRVVDVRYVNLQGMMSDRPFTGVNIVVTTRADGTVTTRKVLH